MMQKDLCNQHRPSDTYLQSFARGLEVICSFSAQNPVQTLSEVAKRTGLTRAGARRILLTLSTLGYVDTDGKKFRLTPRILDLGFAYLSSMPLWNIAEPSMGNLVQSVQESCSIGVLDGFDVVYVHRIHTHKVMSTNLGIGSRLPAFWTSMGRVLLAGQPDNKIQQMLATLPRNPFTRNTLLQDEGLLESIKQTRLKGWSLIDQELEEGLISIAAPLVNSSGHTVAAINVSGQANRTDAQYMKEKILPELLITANNISKLLRKIII